MGFSDAVTEAKLKTIKLRKYIFNINAIRLKPKAHFDLSFTSLEFAKSTFATNTHVKSFGCLQLCGYSHLTRKRCPAALVIQWIMISVRCSLNLVLLGDGIGSENFSQINPILIYPQRPYLVSRGGAAKSLRGKTCYKKPVAGYLDLASLYFAAFLKVQLLKVLRLKSNICCLQ